MFPKINRLTKKKDFDTVFKNGVTVKKDFLVFKVLKNPLGKNRFGFVVSKKVSNRAVVRNTVKRRLRNAFWKELKNIREPIDVIVIALPMIRKKEFPEIQKLVSDFLGQYN